MSSPTGWATAAAVKAALLQKWERGALLRDLHSPPDEWTTFPLRVRLPGPTREQLGTGFAAAAAWARSLTEAAAREGWHVQTRSVRTPGLGTQQVPVAAVVPTPQVALALLGRARAAEADRFAAALRRAGSLDPVARQLALARPHDVLAAGDDWPLLLDLVDWVRRHPRPDVHLRQVPVAGVHTKVLERHTGLLTRLLEVLLPPEAVDPTGRTFAARFGFATESRRARVRGAAPVLGVPADGIADVEWDVAALAALEPRRHGITELLVLENKTSFLTAPLAPGRLALWGAGYGVDELVRALPWRDDVAVQYWGDVDTHGFALLARVRAVAPHTTSVLMDVETFLAHRPFWSSEPRPRRDPLPHLTAPESALHTALCADTYGTSLRLEQEFVRFDLVAAALTPTASVPQLDPLITSPRCTAVRDVSAPEPVDPAGDVPRGKHQ